MKKDITNEVFGNLVAKEYLGAFPVGTQGKTRGKWLCSCSCGKEVDVFTGSLTSGKTKSCGCFGLINTQDQRKCPVCHEFLGKNEFSKGTSACKFCTSERRDAYITAEDRNNRIKDAYPKHREKRLVYAKKYREDNLEKVTENLKKWKQKNPTYKKDRWENDIDFRVKENLRGRFYKAIKGLSKSDSVIDLVGCGIDELKLYLSTLFVEGMSWNNYGEWHIDHKKPYSLFDLSLPSEQKSCFHYTNLQPLWAIDNLRKSNKYD